MAKPDMLKIRREKRSPAEDMWHTIRVGLVAAVPVTIIAILLSHLVLS